MTESKDEHYMSKAISEARKAYEKQEVPVGAVVVYNDIIIARGHNLTETLKDPTAHAEMQVITAATSWMGGKYLTDCTLYVTVEPCAMCAGALGWSQISRLVFGTEDGKKGFTRISNQLLHKSTKVEHGVLQDECKRLVKGFFKTRR